MGTTTEDLIQDCTDAASKLGKALGKTRSAVVAFKKEFDSYNSDDIKDMNKFMSTKKSLQTCSLTFKDLNGALTTTEKAANALSKKLKLKDVMNLFKTQKSLDGAKKVLQETQKHITYTKDKAQPLATEANDLKKKLK